MELNHAERSRAWWKGAIDNTLKGIPQGIMLGILGFAMLVGMTYGLAALGTLGGVGWAATAAGWMINGLGGFLFTQGTAATMASAVAAGTMPAFGIGLLSPLPFVALNTMLTVAGNFLTGGDIGVSAYHQKKHNDLYESRIRELEGRGQMVEHVIGEQSRAVQQILQRGPRSHRDAVAEDRANAPTTPTLQ